MTAGTFNPLAAARDLKAAGVEAEHAEAIAEGMRRVADAAVSTGRDEIATKADLYRALLDPRRRHRRHPWNNNGDKPRDYAVKQDYTAAAAMLERAGSGWE